MPRLSLYQEAQRVVCWGHLSWMHLKMLIRTIRCLTLVAVVYPMSLSVCCWKNLNIQKKPMHATHNPITLTSVSTIFNIYLNFWIFLGKISSFFCHSKGKETITSVSDMSCYKFFFYSEIIKFRNIFCTLHPKFILTAYWRAEIDSFK